MFRFLVGLVRLAFFAGTFFVAACAVLAIFGFATPILDALNHLQPIWFTGTFVALVLSPLVFFRSRFRTLVLALSGIGFVASAAVVLPEAVAGIVKRPPAAPGAQTFRLMTFNVFANSRDPAATLASIARTNPDILALQEYFPGQRRAMEAVLSRRYPYSQVCDHGTKRGNVAIYARLPFSFPEGKGCLNNAEYGTSTLVVRFSPANAPAFTVATTHLDWPIQISTLRKSPDLASGIAGMSARKQTEYERLGADIANISGPLVLVGDFNATSWSYALRGFATENGLTRQAHMLFTYPRLLWIKGAWRRLTAFLPLDHVMTRGGIAVADIETGASGGSDHKPVVVDFTTVGTSGGSSR